jgi:hypothetical protein
MPESTKNDDSTWGKPTPSKPEGVNDGFAAMAILVLVIALLVLVVNLI